MAPWLKVSKTLENIKETLENIKEPWLKVKQRRLTLIHAGLRLSRQRLTIWQLSQMVARQD